MKRFLSILIAVVLLLSLAGCGQQETKTPENTATTESTDSVITTEEKPADDSKILVAYFSQTGNTAPLAQYAGEYLNADLYEIIPAVPYTDADINYHDDSCRANQEQADDTCRPEIAGDAVDMAQYDTVIVAFPIWWGKEPRIIDTFMETYNFSGKTMLSFCTSGSSGVKTAEANLKAMAGDTITWLGAERFAIGTSQETIVQWLSQFDIAATK